MMPVNSRTPNMPRFDTLKVPPWYSSGLSLLSRALTASARISSETMPSDLVSAPRTIGVIRPVGVATATEMSERE